jgi:hypothetical protein
VSPICYRKGDRLVAGSGTGPERWGEWEFKPNLTLVWRGHYEIDLESINSTAQILDWIFHAWHRDGDHLVEAFEAILAPRANCCSGGVEKKFSGAELAKKYADRLTPRRAKIPPKVRFDVLASAGYRCQACGASASDGAELHVDHIIPRALGGTDVRSNLQALCRTCNLGKGARLL